MAATQQQGLALPSVAVPAASRRVQFHPAGQGHMHQANANGGGDAAAASAAASSSNASRGAHDSAVQDGDQPPLPLSWTAPSKVGAGLSNLGNTCFLNSVLQCLTYTPPLAGYLQSGHHKVSCRVPGFCAMCSLEEHVRNALVNSGKSIAPSNLVKNLRSISRTFRMWRQEDAHEYMRCLIEALQKCSLPAHVTNSASAAEQEKSFVFKIFGGRLRSQVKCTVCLHCSNTHDPFLDLSLEIVRADSLTKALSRFTAVEELDGENKYRCGHCKKKVRALKNFTIDSAPNVLTIQFKRFSSTPGRFGKIDKKVEFGQTLDLKPYMSSGKEGDVMYSLYGVLVHSGGSTHSGHYYSFVKTSTGIWHVLDDSRVRQVSENTVMEQKAYMLFYIKNARSTASTVPGLKGLSKSTGPGQMQGVGQSSKDVEPDGKLHVDNFAEGSSVCPTVDNASRLDTSMPPPKTAPDLKRASVVESTACLGALSASTVPLSAMELDALSVAKVSEQEGSDCLPAIVSSMPAPPSPSQREEPKSVQAGDNNKGSVVSAPVKINGPATSSVTQKGLPRGDEDGTPTLPTTVSGDVRSEDTPGNLASLDQVEPLEESQQLGSEECSTSGYEEDEYLIDHQLRPSHNYRQLLLVNPSTRRFYMARKIPHRARKRTPDADFVMEDVSEGERVGVEASANNVIRDSTSGNPPLADGEGREDPEGCRNHCIFGAVEDIGVDGAPVISGGQNGSVLEIDCSRLDSGATLEVKSSCVEEGKMVSEQKGESKLCARVEAAQAKRPSCPSDVKSEPVKEGSRTELNLSSGQKNQLYGCEVPRWNESDATGMRIDALLSSHHKPVQKRLDEWDEEYDRGRVKKIRKRADRADTADELRDRPSSASPFHEAAASRRH